MRSSVLLLILGVPCYVAAQCDTMALYVSEGTYKSNGIRGSDMTLGKAGPDTQRMFVAARLPRFSQPPQTAWLEFYQDQIQSPNPGEVVRAREVRTAPFAVYGSVTNGLAVFQDLGDGLIYGTQILTNQTGTFPVRMDLNSDALAAISPNAGREFVLGLELAGADTAVTNRSVWVIQPRLHLEFSSAGAPVVYDSTADSISALTNVPAQLWVHACGAETLTYQWYRDGAAIPGATTEAFIVTVEAGMPGLYCAVVNNNFGSTTSILTHVFVNEIPPYFYSQPSSATLLAGTSLWLGAGVQGVPYPDLQWFHNGQALPGKTNLTLVITDCRVEHSGSYWLTASNQAGSCVSQVAQVTVYPLQVALGYGGVPYPGSTFYLFSSTYSYAPAVSYQWRRDGLELPGATAPALTLTNFLPTQEGSYELVACNAYGCASSGPLRVTAGPYAPEIFSLVCDPQPAAGCDLVISAELSGARPLWRQWFFEGTALAGETNDALIVPRAETSASGRYTLVVTNSYGAATNSLVVSVSEQPPGSVIVYYSVELLGNSCLLTAGVDYWRQGVPGSPASFTWTHEGQELPGQTNDFLFIPKLSMGDAGLYSFTAANAYGTATGVCNVLVLPRRALEQWTWRAPLPQGNDLHNLAFGNGRYVACGDRGETIWSSNAVQWSRIPVHFEAREVKFVNGEYIATDWLRGWMPQVCYVSTDGENWRARKLSAPETYGCGALFAKGIYTTGISNSVDGLHWRAGTPMTFQRIAFGNDRFVALGYGPGTTIWSSADGAAWFAGQTLQVPLRALAFGKGLFVAAGEDGFLFTSADGLSWTSRGRVVSRDINDILFDGTQFVGCGNRGLVITSSDGSGWTVRAGELQDLFGVVYAKDKFVAVGDQGTILTSPNGHDWTAQYSATSRDLHGIAYGNGSFVAVGRQGTVLSSPDGITWIPRPIGTASYLERVCYGNGQFLAVGNTPPAILTSADALSWQAANLGPLNLNPAARLEACAAGAGQFMVVGGYFEDPIHENRAIPQLFTSSDGRTWQRRTAPQYSWDGKILRALTFGHGLFAVGGNDGLLSWSTDGSSWFQPFGFGHNLRSILYHDQPLRFVAVGNEGNVVSGLDLWTSHDAHLAQNLHDVAFGQNKYVAVGNGGMIVESDQATPIFTPVQAQTAPTFSLRGGIEPEYLLEASEDLQTWNPRGVFTNDGSACVLEFTPLRGQEFYRVRSP